MALVLSLADVWRLLGLYFANYELGVNMNATASRHMVLSIKKELCLLLNYWTYTSGAVYRYCSVNVLFAAQCMMSVIKSQIPGIQNALFCYFICLHCCLNLVTAFWGLCRTINTVMRGPGSFILQTLYNYVVLYSHTGICSKSSFRWAACMRLVRLKLLDTHSWNKTSISNSQGAASTRPAFTCKQ